MREKPCYSFQIFPWYSKFEETLGLESISNHTKQKLSPHLDRTFLAAGNAAAHQSVADGVCHGLPPLSDSLRRSIFSSGLSLPQPLDPRSLQVSFRSAMWNAGVLSLHFHLAPILQGLHTSVALSLRWPSFTPRGATGTRDQELVSGRVFSANVPWNDWGNSLPAHSCHGKTKQDAPKGLIFSTQ